MDREGRLPERCVICNEPSQSRVRRSLSWTPRAWRLVATAVPIGFAFFALAIGPDLFALLVPLLVVLFIAGSFFRKSLKLELGVCPRHRRRWNALRWLSFTCFAVFAGSFPMIGASPALAYRVMLGSAVALLGLGIAQSFLGLQSIRVRELSKEHAWLSGTGKRFRAALPELD